jgi:hypothetical protein
VNVATYRQKKEVGWVVSPSIREKGNEAVTWGKQTLELGHCRFVGQSIRGRGTRHVTQRKHNDYAYDSHCNETYVTDKRHSNAIRLKSLRIQTKDPS